MHSVILPDPYNSHGQNLTTGSFLRRTLLLSVFALASLAVPLTTRGQNTNTAYGTGALFDSSGTDNTAIGFSALTANTSGSSNTAVGAFTLEGNSTGQQNTAIGEEALGEGNGNYSTATGFEAMTSSSGAYNVADGWQALYSNSSGYENTANGATALYHNQTGTANTADGYGALASNVVGHDNTAQGFWALLSSTGSNNVAVGSYSGLSLTGSNNIVLGYAAGQNLTTGSNNIEIGNNGKAGESGKMRIGTAGKQTATFVAGIYNIAQPAASGIKPVYINSNGQLGTAAPASSRRFKTNIKPMEQSSESVLALKPVMFRYKNDEEATQQFGLIAEEVAKVNPDLVVRDEDGQIYTVRYEAVNAMLLNEFIKAHRKLEEQQTTIERQQRQIESLTNAVHKVAVEVELSKAATQTAANHQ